MSSLIPLGTKGFFRTLVPKISGDEVRKNQMEILLPTWQWACKLGVLLFKAGESIPCYGFCWCLVPAQAHPLQSPGALQATHCTALHQHREKQLLGTSVKLIPKLLWALGILNLPITEFHTSLNYIRLFFKPLSIKLMQVLHIRELPSRTLSPLHSHSTLSHDIH